MDKLIFGLDIGSSKIVSLVGSIGTDIQIEGVSTYNFVNSSKSNDFLNINHGTICNLSEVSAKVERSLHEVQINADCSSGGVITNISGPGVMGHHVTQDISLETTVTQDILDKLSRNIDKNSIPPTHEILSHEIQEYYINNEHPTLNPLNLSVSTLRSNVMFLLARSNQVSNLRSLMRNSGHNLVNIVPSAVLSGMAILNTEEKDCGCCLIDIGYATTDVIVYQNGFIRYLYSFSVGGQHITSDISSVLRIPLNLAEDLKLTHGKATHGVSSNSRDAIVINDHRGVSINISHKLLTDIIKDRIYEIFDLIKADLIEKKIYDIISSGLVLTGGSSLLPGISQYVGSIFDGMQCRVGTTEYNGDFSDLLNNPKYATALGAMYFAKDTIHEQIQSNSSIWNKIKTRLTYK